jgi:hypothetical protein
MQKSSAFDVPANATTDWVRGRSLTHFSIDALDDLSQATERILHKQPNKITTNDRTKSLQTTEKASKDLYNSIIISIFAAKLSNKRKMGNIS